MYRVFLVSSLPSLGFISGVLVCLVFIRGPVYTSDVHGRNSGQVKSCLIKLDYVTMWFLVLKTFYRFASTKCVFKYIYIYIYIQVKNPRRARTRAETGTYGSDWPSRPKSRALSITPLHHPQIKMAQ